MIAPGICRHCHCTDDEPCTLQTGEACSWTDRTRTVCNNPACVTAEATRKRQAAAASKVTRLNSADVHKLIMGRGRGRRGRKARAA